MKFSLPKIVNSIILTGIAIIMPILTLLPNMEMKLSDLMEQLEITE